ncbi:hypothetical protein CTAYLR_002219 [Chrysophaeum taylorii]|uniref:Oxidoreductase n=1 Tax=Chrysophaeum taylorii TaxID=2483200 RepID=A0AAD7UP69_9STRA|nr:hypothetical protein CTAYLR_002219 [Chrysophaeum taylorii]
MILARVLQLGLAAPSLTTRSALYENDSLSDETYEVPGGFCERGESTTVAFGRFAGKVAIVTGAAGTFGAACARRFAAEGASVALFDIRSPDEVRSELDAEHDQQNFTSHVVDVTDFGSVEAAVADVVASHGRLDYAFNNAGYQGDFLPVDRYDTEDFRRVTDVNLNGCFNVLKAAANAMQSQTPRGGCIVQTASMAGHSAPPNMPAYAASKAAVDQLTKAASKDLAPFDIRVNSVSPAFIGPGFMWTRQIELQAAAGSIYYDPDPAVVARQMIDCTPLKRYGTIDEVVGPVLFLFSDDASYLTGVDIQITGGIN